MTTILPTLPGLADGVVGHDLTGYHLQCHDCHRVETTGTHGLLLTMRRTGMRFHHGGWPNGTNPRLCRPCRQARGCDCTSCHSERQGTEYPA